MAITQQIVRLPVQSMMRASVASDTLLDLISFRLVTPADTLDLNWAPDGLKRLAACLGPEVQAALHHVTNGSKVVNPQYPKGPGHACVYSPITWLSAVEVAKAARILDSVATETLLRALPAEPDAIRAFLGQQELPANPEEYYRDYFLALVRFTRGAADRNLAMAMWWD